MGSGTDVEGPERARRSPERDVPAVSHVRASGMRRSGLLRFFAAIVLSVYGDWLSTVALVVVLFQLTRSSLGPAVYILVRVAPRVAGPWLGGGLADRLTPGRVMIASALVQAPFTALLIPLHGARAVWAIYVVVAVAQFAGSLGRPSQAALIPRLVGEGTSLPRVNAAYGLVLNTSIFIAPAVGAALLLRLGPDLLFAVDAATFLASAVLIATLRRHAREPHSAEGAQPGAPSNRALSMAFRLREVRVIAAANFASGLVVTVIQALLVVAAHDRFGGDATVGYLYSGVGAGAAVGGLIALRWRPSHTWTRTAVFLAVVTEVVAVAGVAATATVLVALVLLAVSAAMGSSFDTWSLTSIQRLAPRGFMGRYSSLIFVSLYAGMLVGGIWAVATAPVLRWDVSLELACAAALVIVAAVWLSGGDGSTTLVESQLEAMERQEIAAER